MVNSLLTEDRRLLRPALGSFTGTMSIVTAKVETAKRTIPISLELHLRHYTPQLLPRTRNNRQTRIQSDSRAQLVDLDLTRL